MGIGIWNGAGGYIVVGFDTFRARPGTTLSEDWSVVGGILVEGTALVSTVARR